MILGVTGNIATGKSTVSKMFEEFGFKYYDADSLAKECYYSNSTMVSEVETMFGCVILEDGILKFDKLSELVFSDKSKMERLNCYVKPTVLKYIDEVVFNNNEHELIIYESALMIENKTHLKVDSLVVVHTHLDTRIERLMNRNDLSEQQALNRIYSQRDQNLKLPYADYIVLNHDLESSKNQVELIIKKLKEK